MPNFKKHATTGLIWGGVAGGVTNVIGQLLSMAVDSEKKFDWNEFGIAALAGGTVGFVSAALPDILEPARSSSHRKLFHSVLTGGVVCAGVLKANASDLHHSEKGLINSAGIAYLSHLILDASTPKSIPWVA